MLLVTLISTAMFTWATWELCSRVTFDKINKLYAFTLFYLSWTCATFMPSDALEKRLSAAVRNVLLIFEQNFNYWGSCLMVFCFVYNELPDLTGRGSDERRNIDSYWETGIVLRKNCAQSSSVENWQLIQSWKKWGNRTVPSATGFTCDPRVTVLVAVMRRTKLY
jgi:hypothetical protein